MINIAHRGNFCGELPEHSNKPSHLRHALTLDYWIICDVQTHNGELHFGHEEPLDLVDFKILTHEHTICRACDLDAVQVLHNLGAHYFWNQSDDISITSEGIILCFNGKRLRHRNAIWVDLDGYYMLEDADNILGICSNSFI
jgi:hypothetical protein